MAAASPPEPLCERRPLVIAHFEEGLPPARERELREHLRSCDECRQAYERELLLERLDPAATTPQQRLGRALGIGPRRDRKRWLIAVAAAASVLLAVGVARHLDHAQPTRPTTNDTTGFQARGGEPARAAPELLIYQSRAGQRLRAAKELLRESDELAFAYRNPGDHPYLLIFAFDDTNKVYWYHPGWKDAAANPAAIAIGKGVALRELPAAIRHDYGGKQLTVVGLFTVEPLRVRQVEAMLRAATFDPARAFEGKNFNLVLHRYALQPLPQKAP